MEIRDRILQIAEIKGVKVTNLEKELCLSKSYFRNAKSISADDIVRFLGLFPNILPDWLLRGEGPMEREPLRIDGELTRLDHAKATEKMSDDSVTLYDIEAAANLQSLMANKDANVLGLISFPNLPKCDGAVYVRGDSMYPLLKSGDIVLFKEISDVAHNIVFGEMYLISIDLDGDEYLTVKYVNSSERGNDWIKLVSYNQHHAPKDFPLTSVRAIALVKASIRLNTMR